MIETPDYTLAIYGISAHRGFLPDKSPLEELPNSCYEPWERITKSLPALIQSDSLRTVVEDLPLFDTSLLQDQAEWMRAYVVFSFLTHAYIWGGERPSQRLPPQLTIPFLLIADHFALPTTATYAGLNLWNWKAIDARADIGDPDNLTALHTFTGTLDEAWFYVVSVSIEAKAAPIVPTMLECFEAAKVDNTKMLLHCLRKTTMCITEMGCILDRMYEKCDPQVFYHQIRPFLAGSKGMGGAGLVMGVFYDEGDGKGCWREYSGGSNAQSSLIQLLDVMLGVEHNAKGQSAIESSAVPSKAKGSYLQEMRNYMPGPHRHFLTYVSSIANIREYVNRSDCEPAVRNVFIDAVAALTTFRDKHIRIASRYIIAPSRQAASKPVTGRLNIASSSTQKHGVAGNTILSGTGGTALMPFLKQTRDETRATAEFDRDTSVGSAK